MKTALRRFIRLAVLGVVIGIAAWPAAAPTAHADDAPVKITVKIIDTGFDPPVITVNQGAAVELTFVFAQTGHLNDEHIMKLDEYKIETDKIDRDHPSTTVKFVATKPGTFKFYCDIECDIHKVLQGGTLKVNVASGGGGSAALTATKVQVDPVANISVRNDHILIDATVVDKDGKPVPKADVAFLVEADFAGFKGLMEVGGAKTGAAGQAQFTYYPTRTEAAKMVVRYEGGGIYDASETTIDLPGNRLFGNVVKAEDNSLHGIKTWARVGFVLVIGGVWGVFIILILQAVGIRRAGSGGAS